MIGRNRSSFGFCRGSLRLIPRRLLVLQNPLQGPPLESVLFDKLLAC